MKKRMIVAGLIVLLLISAGCTLLGLKSVNRITDWHPLADGWTYTYNYKYYFNGTLYEDYDQDEVIKSVTADGDRYLIQIDDWTQIVDSGDGCIYEGSQDHILLKTPIKVGNKWNDGADNEITEVGANRTVEYGTLSGLIRIEYTEDYENGTETGYYYYSPDLGRDVYYYIHFEYDDGDEETEIYELIDLVQ